MDMRRSSMSSRGRWDAVVEFSDEPENDSSDHSNRSSFDVDSERESQLGDVDAERNMHALQERLSQLMTETIVSYQRRRMTDPTPRYKLQREEIHVEPLATARLRFPTTARFERGVKINRRATYTPSSTITTPQFHTNFSSHGVSALQRRTSVVGVAYEREKLELDRVEVPEADEEDPTTDHIYRWTMAVPSTSSELRHERVYPTSKSKLSDLDEASMTKVSRRRRLSVTVKSWFK